MSGFSRELFVDAVEDDYICSICHGVFNNPVMCESGHSFCIECISQWKSTHSTCPVDRQILSHSLIRNLAVVGVIKKKILKCPSTATIPGCSWTGQVSCLEKHLKQECPMEIVECVFKSRGCILRTYKGELEGHLSVCPYRTVKCPSCNLEMSPQALASHDDSCDGKSIPCINACGIEIERCKMLSHLAFVCKKESRACPLYPVGCTEKSGHGGALSNHADLLFKARINNDASLQGTCYGASWMLVENVALPIFSPLFEAHAVVVRAEFYPHIQSVGVRLHMECLWDIPCFRVDVRCCFRCGEEKIKFRSNIIEVKSKTAAMDIHDSIALTKFQQFMVSDNVLFFDFLLQIIV